jgi:hypothetical protein
MAAEVRWMDVDFSWVNGSRHPQARETVSNELFRRGWEHGENLGDSGVRFFRNQDVDFDNAVAAAQQLVGSYLVEGSEESEALGSA